MRNFFIKFFSLIIRAYQVCISPLHKPCCRFYPTCSNYALEAINKHGIVGLSGLILVSYPNITDRLDNLFIFCNSTRNQIKILHFDETGIWLYQKRLNKGKFIYPDSKGDYLITKENLITILQGLNFIQKIEGKTNQDYALF